ncbi:MAG: NTP transferase domain-containing protein [Muribaculaceae bacterium]|nr:NTP transferase domain-containing protein [Muribaculaceae bacterium]
MKAFVLAAGLGTRLRPWTLHHPKALVPVAGVPMLERVIGRLRSEGFDDICVNVHHFSEQIVQYLTAHDLGVAISISEESDKLLDTGGGLAAIAEWADNQPVLVHNVDILSDAPLGDIMRSHVDSMRDVTLVTDNRESSRHLIFRPNGALAGWHNVKSGEYRPSGFVPSVDDIEEAFSGIYVIGPRGFESLREYRRVTGRDAFPVMDWLLSLPEGLNIRSQHYDRLKLIDIGKPDTLLKAEEEFSR